MTNHKFLKKFTTAIQHNCDISDASGAGLFSICGMALRLRDLNKWQKGLQPWEENTPEALVGWIDSKEKLWENLEQSNFSGLPLLGNVYDPFDTKAINSALEPFGLFYGAGYAHSLKPTFFLADIEQVFDLMDFTVIVLGREIVRDLLTIPALNQDDAILVRKDAARYFLWDQMAYLKKSGRKFLHFALNQCGLPDTGPDTRKTYFDKILTVQEQTYIHHEIGEITDTVFNREFFRELVSRFPHTPVELLARTVKDLLADTGPNGTLAHLIKTKNAAGLGFYAAFQDGLFVPLFPELRKAVQKFESDKNWKAVELVREKGISIASDYTKKMADMFERAQKKKTVDEFPDKINEKLIQPLIAT